MPPAADPTSGLPSRAASRLRLPPTTGPRAWPGTSSVASGQCRRRGVLGGHQGPDQFGGPSIAEAVGPQGGAGDHRAVERPTVPVCSASQRCRTVASLDPSSGLGWRRRTGPGRGGPAAAARRSRHGRTAPRGPRSSHQAAVRSAARSWSVRRSRPCRARTCSPVTTSRPAARRRAQPWASRWRPVRWGGGGGGGGGGVDDGHPVSGRRRGGRARRVISVKGTSQAGAADDDLCQAAGKAGTPLVIVLSRKCASSAGRWGLFREVLRQNPFPPRSVWVFTRWAEAARRCAGSTAPRLALFLGASFLRSRRRPHH